MFEEVLLMEGCRNRWWRKATCPAPNCRRPAAGTRAQHQGFALFRC